jgi:hypothetical protein
MSANLNSNTASRLLASVLVGGLVIVIAHAQSVPGNPEPAAPAAKSRVVPYRYRTHPAANLAQQQFARVWGVDSFSVTSVQSGALIRFTYRVLDPQKAKALNDGKNVPELIDPRAGVKLAVALREQGGELGQNVAPEVGGLYTLTFSNLDGKVKPGHRVEVIVGQFRAERLLVRYDFPQSLTHARQY